ncbi:MAG: cache domain-containing protein [Gammaproteobacteria bacterium]|jgi:cytochrome c
MRKYKILTLLALFIAIPTIACAQSYWNPRSETVSLVKEGIAYFHQYGAEEAFKAFNQRYGRFIRGNLYLFVYNFNGVCQANGGNPRLAGKNLLNNKDIHGNRPVKLLIDKARTGGGWVSYYWKNPATGQNAQKLSYVKPLGHQYLIGAGYYFNRR